MNLLGWRRWVGNRFLFKLLVTMIILLQVSIIMAAETRKNFFIPQELQTELWVKAAYNDSHVFFLFEWPAEKGSIYHDYVRFQEGEWIKTKGSAPGIHPLKLYEDRVSFLLDDGSVRYFDTAGGYVTVHEEMRFLSNQASKEEVESHPYLGGKKGRTDVRKYIPETREGENWRNVREAELKSLFESGVFLDLWMWRSHRSNPLGYADDMWVMEYRNGDQGKSSYGDNWDAEKQQPKFMYDRSQVGFYSLRWEDVVDHKLTQDDTYYLSTEIAVPFDPDREWKEGDTIPRRLLRIPEGSRGDILGKGKWRDGRWRVEMQRLLNTGHPDDKVLRDKRRYALAFAVHKNYTGSRWHHVSLPYRLGMGVEAEIVARKFQEEKPPWEAIPWMQIALFYPGQVTWEFLTGPAHAGAAGLMEGRACGDCHSPELLGRYSVEHELGEEIRNRWYYTLVGGAVLLVGLAFSGIVAARRRW